MGDYIRRTFIFSQMPLDKDEIKIIASDLAITEDTEFTNPDPSITVGDLDIDLTEFDDVIFADSDTRCLYDLTQNLESFLSFLNDFVPEEETLTDAALDYLLVE